MKAAYAVVGTVASHQEESGFEPAGSALSCGLHVLPRAWFIVSIGTMASSHRPKTCRLGELATGHSGEWLPVCSPVTDWRPVQGQLRISGSENERMVPDEMLPQMLLFITSFTLRRVDHCGGHAQI